MSATSRASYASLAYPSLSAYKQYCTNGTVLVCKRSCPPLPGSRFFKPGS